MATLAAATTPIVRIVRIAGIARTALIVKTAKTARTVTTVLDVQTVAIAQGSRIARMLVTSMMTLMSCKCKAGTEYAMLFSIRVVDGS